MIYLFAPIMMNVNENINITAKIHRVGGNTGNIVWFEAVRRQIVYDDMGTCPSGNMGVTNVVFSMANQINVQDKSLEYYSL